MQKNLKLLVVILVVLSTILTLKSFLPQRTSQLFFYKEKTKNLKKENVTVLTISKNSAKVKLVKEGDIWKIDGKKADKAKIEDLLRELLPEESPELISQTDTKHSEFEVTSETGTQAVINDSLIVILGKAAAAGGVYARIDPDKNVFLLKNLYSSGFSTAQSFWTDKTVVAIDRPKLKKLEIKQSKKTITLVNKDDKWVEEKSGQEPNKEKLDVVISSLSSLIADNLAGTESAKLYPSKSKLEIKIEYDGGGETLSFYQGKSDYKVIRLSDKEAFIINNSAVQKFLDL